MNSNYPKKLCLAIALLSSSGVFAKSIYVSPNGNDAAAGNFNAPFKTLAKASLVARAGDVVYLREGTYHETLRPAFSGKPGKPITFTGFKNEQVIISAMEPIDQWQWHEKDIYKAKVSWNLGQSNFVMQNETAMDLARWPNNVDGDPFSPNAKRSTGGSDGKQVYNEYISYEPGIPDIDWTGGSVWFYGDAPGSGWLAWQSYIKDNDANRVVFDLDKNVNWIAGAHPPSRLGEFFLQGVYGALDYKNEWYYDKQSKELYVIVPHSKKPAAGQVQMRRRMNGVDLSQRSHIKVQNLAVFGGSIEIKNGSYNTLSAVTSLYGNTHLGVTDTFAADAQSVFVSGKNNRIEHSEIGFGSGSGIRDAGDGTVIIDSYVHDFNTLGDYNAAINSRGGRNSKYLHNTITRAGRDTIQAFNANSEWAYNDVSYSNLIADDCALFYTVGGPHNTVVHHNWFHDAYSRGNKKKAAGIYLDNDTENFSVHHNVIWNTEWTNIQINWDGKNIDIFNNTLLNGSQVMGAWHKAGTKFTNVRVWNNLSDDSNWEEQSNKQNNLVTRQDIFVDSANKNFTPKPGSVAVSAGRLINGITDNVTIGQPDVGAYQHNEAPWSAGMRWNKLDGATGWGCYNLPGEACVAQ